VNVRPERATDSAALRRLNEAAFGRPDEADLVQALAAANAVTLSLVAEIDDELAGHILFSPVVLDPEGGRSEVVGLAPMAVLPGRQRRGVGSALVRVGLDELRRRGFEAVVVLGHPDYYPRFGFTPASRFALRCEFACSDDAFMALALRRGGLTGPAGVVRYRPEFARF
jgi:putative acetyltransferase